MGVDAYLSLTGNRRRWGGVGAYELFLPLGWALIRGGR